MADIEQPVADREVAHTGQRAETAMPDGAGRDAKKALHRIVVVGGGAGGLELVTCLGNRLGRRGRASVTLVERARTHVWKPLLHAVAAGAIDPAAYEVNYIAQAHWHGFRYHFGEMIGLDRDRKEVRLAAAVDDEGRQITPPSTVGFDTLVIAIGSVTNDFGTPGVATYALPLETPAQAQRFNRRLINACLRAQTQEGPVRPGQLHVAIVGAGATGTELAAELHRTIREVVGYGLDRIDPQRDVRIVLIEAAPRILNGLPERISEATQRLLEQMGVEVRTGAQVMSVTAEGLTLADGTFIAAELVVWAAGVKAPAVLRDLDGLEVNRINQLVVRQTLQTTRDPDVFAVGDCAACPRPGSTAPVPPRAQSAHQEASLMARQIERRLRGQALLPFQYRDFGSLVSLGKWSTVGQLMGFLFGRGFFIEGLFAQIMYRSLRIMHDRALGGTGRAMLGIFVRALARGTGPQVKLH
ncbi:MAG TPA: NAD(P)/FAD-dependent oxidoreductase [Acetobacteraceae bacterium]|nr:NAD(P)/FAD-dependent oxidoreductase [Acetobacteraceae bacterium]